MSKVQTTPDGKHIVDTGLPQRFIKSIWLEMHRDMNLKILEAILNSKASERKVIRAIRFSFSMILDEDARKTIKEKVDKRTIELTTGIASNELVADATEQAYIEAIEDMTDYIDQAFGVSHRIAIGID